MAGPRGESADTSLDDILSSIRKIVSDDLNGADALRDKLVAAQAAAAAPAAENGSHALPTPTPAEPVAASPIPSTPAEEAPVNAPDTAALIAAARAAAGTPARAFVDAEARVSQAEIDRPKDSLAPFDRGATPVETAAAVPVAPVTPEPVTASDLGAPITLPTEEEGMVGDVPASSSEANGQVANGQPQTETTPVTVPSNGASFSSEVAAAQPAPEVSVDASDDEPFDLDQAIDSLNGELAPVPQPLDEVTDLNGHTRAPFPIAGTTNGAAAAQSVAPETAPVIVEANGSSAIEPVVVEMVPTAGEMNGVAGDATLASTEAAPVDAPEAVMPEAVAPALVETIDEAAVSPEPGVVPEPAASAKTEGPGGGLSSRTLEATVARMLRPMLKEWLDENMPRLIEEALREDMGAGSETSGV